MYKAAAAVIFLAVGLVGLAHGDFAEEINPSFNATWIAQTLSGREDAWHNGKHVVGGLGYDVALDIAPRLVQRSFCDALNFINWSREVYMSGGVESATYMELGMVRGSVTGAPALAASNWTYKKYTSGSLTYYVSRLSPAVLIQTADQQLDFFAGTKFVGNYKNHPENWIMPSHLAFRTASGVTVADARTTVDLSGMTESWMLVWFGWQTNFRRTTIPNILARVEAWVDYYNSGDLFVLADFPVLVVFDKKPAQITPVSDALRVSFGAEGAGSVAVLPPFGFNHLKSDQTQGWAASFPSDVAERCSTWAKRVKVFPLTCKEEREIVNGGESVTIRHTYTYMNIADEWGTIGEQIAPIAPAVMMAKQYGGDITLSGTPADCNIPTHSGPYTGVEGADTVSYTIEGLDKYIDEEVVSPDANSAETQPLVAELRSEVRKMIDAGPLNCAMELCRKQIEKAWTYFISTSETLQALADAMPYLEPADKADAIAYGQSELSAKNPLTTALPKFDSSRGTREYWTPLSINMVEQVSDSGTRLFYSRSNPRIGIRTEDKANSTYALWAFGKASSDWGPIQALWGGTNGIKTRCYSGRNYTEWATMGYFGLDKDNTGGSMMLTSDGENRGSSYSANGQFGRFVALARLARQFNDTATEDTAIYLLARTALLRLAQEKLIEYIYDSGIVTIDESADWMYKYSTAHGEGGPGYLWTDNWSDHTGDVRKVLLWDERGPLVSNTLSGDWDPILFTFMLMSPEAGRFLHDHAYNEQLKYLQRIEENAPAWFLVRRASYVGKETHMDSPLHAFNIYMGMIYAVGQHGDKVLTYQDMPFVKTGDLYHMQRLVGALRALNGLQWQQGGAP